MHGKRRGRQAGLLSGLPPTPFQYVLTRQKEKRYSTRTMSRYQCSPVSERP